MTMDLRCEAIATAVLGAPHRQSGAELFYGCPNHEDKHPSLQVNTRKNAFLCGPCGKGGNAWCLAAFIGHIEPNDKKAVASWLRDHGLLANGNGNGNGNGHHARTVSDEPKPDFVRVAEFYYGPDLRKVRLERPTTDGSKPQKSFRWEHREGENWKSGDGGFQKPLYTNQLFREREQLEIALGFEGEAKAELAGEFGFAGFSFKNLCLNQCDVLADLDVILWPDADAPGFKQCNDAAKILHESEQPRLIRVITTPAELPINGDIVDAVRSLGWRRERIEKLIAEAKTYPPEPPLVGVLLDDVQERKIEWLWQDRIPRGAITILDGDPGLGKSLLCCEIAARRSRGLPLPGETAKTTPGGVVILSAEDSIECVIKPRLRAAGGDLTRILAVPYTPEKPGEAFFEKLPADLPILERAVRRVSACLVIFDVLVAYIPVSLSTKSDQEVRLALAPLKDLCERMNFASFALRHLNKNATGPIIYRGGGSIGIGGAARSNLLLAADPNNAELRVLAGVKNNYGRMPESLNFTVKLSDERIPYVEWRGSSSHTGESLLAVQADSSGEDRNSREEAREFILQELTNGRREAKYILRTAKSVGIAERTLKRAKTGVAKSFSENGTWYWKLVVNKE
jgi:hypothetical protein